MQRIRLMLAFGMSRPVEVHCRPTSGSGRCQQVQESIHDLQFVDYGPVSRIVVRLAKLEIAQFRQDQLPVTRARLRLRLRLRLRRQCNGQPRARWRRCWARHGLPATQWFCGRVALGRLTTLGFDDCKRMSRTLLQHILHARIFPVAHWNDADPRVVAADMFSHLPCPTDILEKAKPDALVRDAPTHRPHRVQMVCAKHRQARHGSRRERLRPPTQLHDVALRFGCGWRVASGYACGAGVICRGRGRQREILAPDNALGRVNRRSTADDPPGGKSKVIVSPCCTPNTV